MKHKILNNFSRACKSKPPAQSSSRRKTVHTVKEDTNAYEEDIDEEESALYRLTIPPPSKRSDLGWTLAHRPTPFQSTSSMRQ